MNSIDNKGRDALRYLTSSPGELEKFATEILSFLHKNEKLLPLLETFFDGRFSVISAETRREIKIELRHFILTFEFSDTIIENTIERRRQVEAIIRKLAPIYKDQDDD